MANEKLRRQIVFEAARMMYTRQESEYYRAKIKAARKICDGWVKPSELPSNSEIRDEIQRFAFMHEGESRFDKLRDMRVQALWLMLVWVRVRVRRPGPGLVRTRSAQRESC